MVQGSFITLSIYKSVTGLSVFLKSTPTQASSYTSWSPVATGQLKAHQPERPWGHLHLDEKGDDVGPRAEGLVGWKFKWQQEAECDLISSLVSEADLLLGKLALIGT
jgi:hypothetical protein